MNLLDPSGVVHEPNGGLSGDNEAFQMLIDAGFTTNIDARCKPNLPVKRMTDAAVSCIACLAVQGMRRCFICSKHHHGACDVATLTG